MLLRGRNSAARQLQLTESGPVERVMGQALFASYRLQLFQSFLGTLGLCDRNRAIQRDDGRGTKSDEFIVQRRNARPVRSLGTRRGRVSRSDRCFHVVLADVITRRR